METQSSIPCSEAPSLEPNLRQNTLHTLDPQYFKINFNNISPHSLSPLHSWYKPG
jgi:hypothetical protein